MSTHQLGGEDVREHLCRGRRVHFAQKNVVPSPLAILCSPPSLKNPFFDEIVIPFLTKLFDHIHTSILQVLVNFLFVPAPVPPRGGGVFKHNAVYTA